MHIIEFVEVFVFIIIIIILLEVLTEQNLVQVRKIKQTKTRSRECTE